jgi:hypothetical protein
VLILKKVKVICFDALLQVLILNGLRPHQNRAGFGLRRPGKGNKKGAGRMDES